MSKGSVSNFTTTSSLPGASMESNEGGEINATRFGNFEVLLNEEGGLYLLGGGGFGKTYKARHVYLNQVVALKVINDRFLHDNSAKERFLREAQVVHQLRHPNIAHVIDFGEVKSALYYAMEFCGGGNLENMVSRIGALPLPIMVRCARQLAEALGCAHSHGFIHRDVKPANIMLTGSDDARPDLKLVDFGLVKHLQGGGSDATAALTMTGQQFFTIQFASPEQLMEEELDARSDLFALGMTLWFLVKGAPPETGSMASIVAKRLDSKAYEALLPGSLPPAHRALLARLLEKDRGLRFQNTSEFLAALTAAEAAPDHVAEVGATAVAEAEPEAGPETVEEEPESRSVTARYDVHENLGAMPLGVLYRATRQSDGEQVAITMVSDLLRHDPTQRAVIEGNVARLRAQPHETIARVYGLEEYEEGLALIQEWHQGISLHSILKTARFLAYAEALRVLLPIAQGTDWTTGQGLPGTVLAMDEIYLQPLDAEAYPEPEKLLEIPLKNWPPFRVRLLPYVIREEASQDVGMTLNTEVVSDPTVAFGSLLYHLVAGHAPRAAAKLSKSAYVTIGRLAEDSNRLLASCIVNERDFGGCEGVLRSLNGSEGVGFSSTTASRTSATPTGGGPIDLTKSRATSTGALRVDGGKTRAGTTSGRLNLSPPATQTGGPKGDTQSKGAVVQTKPLTRTGGLGSAVGGGTTTGRMARDMAREAEEARQKQEAEAAAQLRAQQDEEARLQQQAEEAQLKTQQAEEIRLRKQQADDERLQKQAGEVQLRQQQAEEARLKKQQTEEARLQKLAEETRLKQQQAEEVRLKKQQGAEEARLKKQQAEEARLQKLAEETRLKQQQIEEAQAKKLELQAQKQVATATRPAGPSVPVLAGAGVASLVLVGAIAFFVLHKPTPVVDPTPTPTPPVVVVPTPTPTPTIPLPTAVPMPAEFAFMQGFKPVNAVVRFNGQGLKLSAQGGKVLAPLSGAALGDHLSVEAPGYESRLVTITQEATEKSQVVLHRQQGLVKFELIGGKTDYTTAVFKAISGLSGEQAYVNMSADESAVNIANPGAEISLPTGLYQITLQGPDGLSDPKVQPYILQRRFPVTDRPGPLVLPPSFAGRYSTEFRAGDQNLLVQRTIVIEPGLRGGVADDKYPTIKSQALGTRVSDLVLDSRGVLRGRIRFSLRGRTDAMSYDEQFELSYADGHFNIIGGGWELEPDNATIARDIKAALGGKDIPAHTARPMPQTVTKE